MIRRSPTRIELKLEDLNDFEYIQKLEKKKNPSGAASSLTETQKLRQDRIGLGFRPIRSSSNVGLSALPQSIVSAPAVPNPSTPAPTTPAVEGLSSVSDIAVPATPTTNNDTTPVSMIVDDSGMSGRLGLLDESSSRTPASNNVSNMSLDESL